MILNLEYIYIYIMFLKKEVNFSKQQKLIILTFLCSLLLITVSLFLTQKTRSFNSDDTSWQVILSKWRPFSHQIAYMGSKDNFIINAPFLYIINSLLGDSRSTLFIESLLFTYLNFGLFYFSAFYILKKSKVKINFYVLLPFIWLASFGSYFASLELNPNWRIPEIGFMFIFYVLGLKLYYHEINPLKSRFSIFITILVVILSGLLVYSDSYFLYFGLLPILATYLILLFLKRIDKKIVAIALSAILASILISRLLRALLARIGLFSPGPLLVVPKLLSLKNLNTNFDFAIKSFLYIFGSYSILPTTSLISKFSLFLNFLLISIIPLIFIYLFIYYKYLKKIFNLKKLIVQPKTLLIILFSIVGIFDFIAYMLVDGSNLNSYRYLIIIVFSYIILLSIGIAKIKKGRIYIVVVLLAAIIFNLIFSFKTTDKLIASNINNPPNNENYKLISLIKKNHLVKGYANYWNSNINNYLSKETINILPVSCIKGISKPDYLLDNANNFKQKVNNSFYLINPSLTSPVSCTYQQVIAQFGKPNRIIRYQNQLLLVYHYDLITKLNL